MSPFNPENVPQGDTDLTAPSPENTGGFKSIAVREEQETTLVDSPGSLGGQMYVGPGGDKIACQGEFVLPMRLDDCRVTKSTDQAAQSAQATYGYLLSERRGKFRCI